MPWAQYSPLFLLALKGEFLFNPIPREFAQRIAKPSEQAFLFTSAAGSKDALNGAAYGSVGGAG